MIKNFLAITTIFFSVVGIAQKTNSSPYSFFGIGDQVNLKSVEEMAMGSMGGILDSEYRLSLTNPATYASLQWTTYVFAGGNKFTNFDDGENSQTSSHTSFTYIAMGIPIRGNQGLGLGLQLNTSVGYTLLDAKYDTDDVLIQTNLYEGKGGTNRVFLGYAYKFPFNLNLGIETAYLFGGIDNSILNRRLNVQLATKHKVDSYVKGFEFKTGALYKHNFANDLNVKVGTSFTLGHDLTQEGDEYLFTLDNTNDVIDIPKDTLYSNNLNGQVKYPLKTVLSAGIGQQNKWFVGAEYTFTDALELTGSFYNDQDVYRYINSNIISVGGYFTPKYNSISNYWQRLTYRAGFNYKNIGLEINDTQIKDYGISFGISLPMGLTLSNVNLGFELGQRGETTGNLLKENYFNFRLSLSLNDKWFRKRMLN
ncbi:MAG: hypothetical protein ABFR32_04035 [Bacteroidota bacterium]